MTNYAPCPFCRAVTPEKVKFTWWGGLVGPKLLSHVKCGGCGKGYNGKTGQDNTTKIVIYCVVVGLVCIGLVIAMFAALAIIATLAR